MQTGKPMANKLRETVLGWPVTVHVGERVWATAEHRPHPKTGTIWYRCDKLTVHLPPELGGDRDLDGHVQHREKLVGKKVVPDILAVCRDQTVREGEFGALSFYCWLLRCNGIIPKQLKRAPKETTKETTESSPGGFGRDFKGFDPLD